ncbi:MAG: ATP synthase subunit I [Proteobacteria bacterium]|nr:ATP synthase subunit I [Pseudomonadota bacterium]
MNETLTLALAGLAGIFLGALFFGGLWWTVRKAVTSPRPVLWFLGSMVLRMGLTLAGFYFVADGHWQRLLLCIVGFALARLLVTRLTRPQEKPALLPGEARHEA